MFKKVLLCVCFLPRTRHGRVLGSTLGGCREVRWLDGSDKASKVLIVGAFMLADTTISITHIVDSNDS